MTARIKKYKSIIKKKNNQHFKIVLLAKLNAINILISNALIDSYINYKEFVFTNLFKEYKTKKKKIKNPKTTVEYIVQIWLT